jgi:membrane-bound ClpP family serine protease
VSTDDRPGRIWTPPLARTLALGAFLVVVGLVLLFVRDSGAMGVVGLVAFAVGFLTLMVVDWVAFHRACPDLDWVERMTAGPRVRLKAYRWSAIRSGWSQREDA